VRKLPTVILVLVAALALAGCATPSNTASTKTPTPASTPTPTATPTPTPEPTSALTLGYTFEQIAAVCVPAVEAEYSGTTVTGVSERGPWLSGADSATFEWLTYIPDGVTWTTNTNITFPALCTISDADQSTPTVVYIGVADL
jgi:ABC-type glycerol-3-phosphate transport system substrate-binding protein